MAKPGFTIRKSALLTTCGAAALALGSLTADPDAAFTQAVQATPLIIQGSVSVNSSVPNVDTVTVTGTDAVIDWIPYTDTPGNALTFLPATGTLNFRGTADFAVINRILPASIPGPAVFEGQVNSYLFDALSGANLGAGGNVLFYSANGIILGETARFDVARLVLTTLDPNVASYEAFVTGTDPLSLVGSPTSTARVDLLAGANSSAQITATPEGSYVVIAAPGIRQRGIVDVNGTAAYVAGSEVTVGYAGGLFDITIPVGTAYGTAADPTQSIIHSGTTGGPASTGPNDPHAIIAATRGAGIGNAAELLFSGNLGFLPAASATVENGVIVLAANYDVFGSTVANTFQAQDVTDASDGNILIRNGTITSDLNAHGRTTQILPTFLLNVTGDVFLSGFNEASIASTDGATTAINGTATLFSRLDGEITPAPDFIGAINGQGGTAFIEASLGQVLISGDATVAAIGVGGADTSLLSAGTATGGNARVSAQSGLVQIGGNLLVDAGAGPGFVANPLSYGGSATGGSASLRAEGANTLIAVNGTATVLADGIAAPLGGPASLSPPGTGQGGTASVDVLDLATIDIAGGLTAGAGGVGSLANGATGGNGIGGSLSVTVNNAALALGFDSLLEAQGFGGDAPSGTGGQGQGGDVSLSLQAGGSLAMAGRTLTVRSGGIGGNGSTGGAGAGGDAGLTLDSSTAALGGLGLSSLGQGGAGSIDAGGAGSGGFASVQALAGSVLTVTGAMVVHNTGLGGASLATSGNGGSGTAGTLEFTVDASTLAAASGSLQLATSGTGGAAQGGTGGTGTGAPLTLSFMAGSTVTTGNISLSATARGGNSASGAGGNAVGGTSLAETASSSLTAQDLSVSTLVFGGTGSGGVGGQATGGGAAASFQGASSATLNDISVFSSTIAGGSSGNSGGNATGGPATLTVQEANTRVTVATLSGSQVRSVTRGGDAGGGPGLGGSATGADADLAVQGGASLVFSGSAALENRIVTESQAQGGNSTVAGGTGGAAASGQATIGVAGGSTLAAPGMSLLSTARGGDGSSAAGSVAGGDATSAGVSVTLTNATFSSGLAAISQATGGAASNAAGGQATAGTANMALSGSTYTYRDMLSGTVATTSRLQSIATGGSVTGTGTGGNAGAFGASVTAAATSVFNAAAATDTFAVGTQASGGQSATLLGEAIAGAALFALNASRIDQGNLRLIASSASADSAALGGAGQLAYSERAFFHVDNGSTASLASLALDASAQGARGGSTTGGIAQVSAQGAASALTATTVTMQTNAGGGAANQAGWFLLDAIPATSAAGPAGAGGTITIASLTANATSTTGQASSVQSRLQALAGRISLTGTATTTTTGPLLLQTAQGGVILGGPDAATLTGSLTFTTAGLLTVSGDDAAATSINADRLSLISNDIAIQPGARLRGANLMLLRSTNTSAAMVLGGTASASGYTVTQAEAAAIAGRFLTIEAPVTADNATRDIEVRDLALTGSQGGGITGLSLVTPGKVQVVGQVRINGAGAADALSIRGDQRIELVLPSASLALFAPAGQGQPLPTGAITLRSSQVFMARTSELALMRANPNDATLAALLASDGGATTPAPYVLANTAEIFAGSFLYGQNTGIAGSFNGISVGQATGGLTIHKDTTYGAGPLKVIAYGQQGHGTGAPVTGNAFFAATRFNTSPVTDYTADATFNDCVIQTGICPLPLSEAGVPLGNETLLTGPARAATLGNVTPIADETAFGIDFPGAVSLPGTAEEGIVDDSVTSGGDPAAYADDHDDEDDDNEG